VSDMGHSEKVMWTTS